MRIWLALIFSTVSAFSAGSWNGVSFTAWNSVAISSWNGTGISVTSPFTATTAVFDGSNDYIGRTSALTSVADGKQVTLSFWIRFDGGNGANMTIFSLQDSGSTRLRFLKTTANAIRVIGNTSAGATVIDATSSVTFTSSASWVHMYFTFDMADNTKRHFYFNGSEDASVTWGTYSNSTMDLECATPQTYVGTIVAPPAVQLINGALSEFWFDDSYFNDPTKFASGGHPISLGSTGNTPTGAAPAIYLSLSGSGDSWRTDSSGNGNTFTVTGALGTTTPP